MTQKATQSPSPDLVARVLVEALPYIQRFADQTILIKYGGSTMVSPEVHDAFIKDIVLMRCVGMKPVVVHGGGKAISTMMKRLGKETEFVDGLRVTDLETVEITEMVLKGKVLQEIVTAVNLAGGNAVGISGKDGHLFTARKVESGKKDASGNPVDLGYVGEVAEVCPKILEVLDSQGFIPIISPLGGGEDGSTYNINADSAAGALAAALKARKLILLTDTPGILQNVADPSSLLDTLALTEVDRLIEEKVIVGGMLPKVAACRTAIEGGVEMAHIIDGRIPHALLLEIFTDKGVGTVIRKE
jgi:acetylglutamate kinase